MSSPAANAIDMEALQDAIGKALEGITGVEGVLGATDNAVEYPYITLGEDEEFDASTECVAGSDVFFPVHVWTKEKGFDQNKQICCAVRARLNNQALTVPGHVVKSVFFRRARRFRDPEIGIAHGIVEFDIWIEAAP